MTDSDGFDPLPTFAQERRVRAVADGVPFGTPRAKTVPVLAELPGPVDVSALTGAVRIFAGRHAALRHRFALRGSRVTLRPVGDRMAEIECAVVDESEVRTEVDRPFDVVGWPLIRVGVVQRARPLFYLAADHAISDGGSVVLALREIESAYRALVDGKPVDLAPPGDFAGYARRQRRRYAEGPALAHEVRGVREQLGDRPVEPMFPVDPGAWDGSSGRYAEQELLDAAGIAALMSQCRESRTTPFMAVLAAFGIAVRELTGQAETGILVATHNRDDPADEAGFGWYANMLSLYFPAGERSGFADSVREVRGRLMKLLPYYALPLCRVLDATPAGYHTGIGEVLPTCFMSFVDNRGADGSRWRQLDFAPAYRMGYGMWVVQRESGLRMVIASPRPLGGDAVLVELEQRIADVLRDSVR